MPLHRWFMTAVLALSLSILPAVAVAADAEGKYAVRGIGSSTCKQLVSALESKDQDLRKDAVLLYTSWLNGYLSYVNRTEKETYDIVPLADGAHLLAVVAGQCRANPDALVESVSAQVIGAMSKARVGAESPLVEISVGDQKGSLRKATIIALQQKLIDLKHLKGAADGDFGAGSQKALRAFQKAEKLKETGFPDTDTLLRALLK
jgi:hypothetical protein